MMVVAGDDVVRLKGLEFPSGMWLLKAEALGKEDHDPLARANHAEGCASCSMIESSLAVTAAANQPLADL